MAGHPPELRERYKRYAKIKKLRNDLDDVVCQWAYGRLDNERRDDPYRQRFAKAVLEALFDEEDDLRKDAKDGEPSFYRHPWQERYSRANG